MQGYVDRFDSDPVQDMQKGQLDPQREALFRQALLRELR